MSMKIEKYRCAFLQRMKTKVQMGDESHAAECLGRSTVLISKIDGRIIALILLEHLKLVSGCLTVDHVPKQKRAACAVVEFGNWMASDLAHGLGWAGWQII